MLSSTSNSNERIPNGALGRQWVLAIFLALVLGGAAEYMLRVMGYRPSVVQSSGAWASRRADVDRYPTKHILIIGASRAETGIDPRVIERLLPSYRATMLAVSGKTCFRTLKDIADHTTFADIIIVSVTPDNFIPADNVSYSQQKYIDAYHSYAHHWGGIETFLNQSLMEQIQDRFVIANPPIDELWKSFRTGETVRRPSRCTMRGNRLNQYSLIPSTYLAEIRERHAQLGLTLDSRLQEKWEKAIVQYRSSIRKIQERGGQVILLRCPTTGPVYDQQLQLYPRSRYWDLLSQKLNTPTIHFEDVPGMKELACPEYSHIDFQDVPLMTQALVHELRRLSVISENK